MIRLLIAFGAGWYFGRNPGAGQQVVAAGQQILDATTGQPVAAPVLPDTTIVSRSATGMPVRSRLPSVQ